VKNPASAPKISTLAPSVKGVLAYGHATASDCNSMPFAPKSATTYYFTTLGSCFEAESPSNTLNYQFNSCSNYKKEVTATSYYYDYSSDGPTCSSGNNQVTFGYLDLCSEQWNFNTGAGARYYSLHCV
jgi:hypothetical protein